jgi:adenine-specific DNA-methyltransferase
VHFSRFVVNKDAAPAEWQFRPVKAQVLQEMGFPGETTQQSMKLAKESLGDDAEIIVRKKCQEFALSNADRVFDSKLFQKPSPWLKEHIDRSRDLDHVIEVVRDDLPSILLYKGRQVYFLSNNFREVNGVRRLAQSLSNLWIDLDTNMNDVDGGNRKFCLMESSTLILRYMLKMSRRAAASRC